MPTPIIMTHGTDLRMGCASALGLFLKAAGDFRPEWCAMNEQPIQHLVELKGAIARGAWRYQALGR